MRVTTSCAGSRREATQALFWTESYFDTGAQRWVGRVRTVRADDGNGNVSDFVFSGKANVTCSALNALP